MWLDVKKKAERECTCTGYCM